MEYRHLRPFDTSLGGQLVNGLQQPLFGVIGGFGDDLRPGAPFGHFLGQQQGDKGAGEAKYRTEYQ